MSTPATYSFNVYRGDTYSLVFTIGGDRTADVPTFNVRTSFEAGTTALTLTSPVISQVYDSVNDWTLVTIPMTGTETGGLTASNYVYDVTYAQAGGSVWTPLAGRINMTKGV